MMHKLQPGGRFWLARVDIIGSTSGRFLLDRVDSSNLTGWTVPTLVLIQLSGRF